MVGDGLTGVFVAVGRGLGVAVLVGGTTIGADVGIDLANSVWTLASTVASISGMGCWPQAITNKPKTR